MANFMAVPGESRFSKCGRTLTVFFQQTLFNTSSTHAFALKWFYKVPYLSSTLKELQQHIFSNGIPCSFE